MSLTFPSRSLKAKNNVVWMSAHDEEQKISGSIPLTNYQQRIMFTEYLNATRGSREAAHAALCNCDVYDFISSYWFLNVERYNSCSHGV